MAKGKLICISTLYVLECKESPQDKVSGSFCTENMLNLEEPEVKVWGL